MEGLQKQEKSYDPFLKELWEEYDFPGRAPVSGSEAENRLKQACSKYSLFLVGETHTRSKSSESDRRALHNQIAIMVVGKQRSGMDAKLAEHITDFAFEYAHGYKLNEIDKFSN